MKMMIISLIRMYQWIAACIKPSGCCRFSPSCSAYAIMAYQRHDVVKATLLTMRRLCRCHPWGGYGVDDVPQ